MRVSRDAIKPRQLASRKSSLVSPPAAASNRLIVTSVEDAARLLGTFDHGPFFPFHFARYSSDSYFFITVTVKNFKIFLDGANSLIVTF